MSAEMTKGEKRKLRELAAECHERELADAMTDLYEEFEKWGSDVISVFELNDRIHKFHDGVSRDLYKRYVLFDPALAVLYALEHGIIGEDSVGESILKKLGRQ
jgi:hypothetical protein